MKKEFTKTRTILYIRKYDNYGTNYIDVIYANRVRTFPEEKAPKIAKAFMENANKIYSQFDHLYKRQETIFE